MAELDPDHALFSNWQLYVSVDQNSGALENIAGSPDGTLNGGVGYASDATHGQVIDFDGTDDYADFGTGFDVVGYDTWSFGITCKLDSISGGSLTVFTKGATNAFQWQIVKLLSPNVFRFARHNTTGGAFITADDPTGVAVDTWYSLVGTYNESTDAMVLYSSASTTNGSAGSGTKELDTTGNVRLGARGNSTQFINGQVKYAFIADTILTAQQAADWIADPTSPLLKGNQMTRGRPYIGMGLRI